MGVTWASCVISGHAGTRSADLVMFVCVWLVVGVCLFVVSLFFHSLLLFFIWSFSSFTFFSCFLPIPPPSLSLSLCQTLSPLSFSPSHSLAPRFPPCPPPPPPPPPSSYRCLSLSLSLSVFLSVSLSLSLSVSLSHHSYLFAPITSAAGRCGCYCCCCCCDYTLWQRQ